MAVFYVFCTISFLFLFWDFKTGEKHAVIYYPENFKCIKKEEINKNIWNLLSRFHTGIIYSVSAGWRENKRCPELKEEIFTRAIPAILLYLCYLHYLLFAVVASSTIFLYVMYRNLSLCFKFSVICTFSYVSITLMVETVLYFIDKHREQKKYN